MAQEGKRAHHGVADDGGAQVAHMHFLGQVRRGIVHHHGLGALRARHRQVRIVERRFQLAVQPLGRLKEVDKAGAGDLHLGHRRVVGQRLDQGLGQVAGLEPGGLGQHQGDVGGEVAVAFVLGAINLHRGPGIAGQGAVVAQGVQSVFDQGYQAVFHASSRPLDGRAIVRQSERECRPLGPVHNRSIGSTSRCQRQRRPEGRARACSISASSRPCRAGRWLLCSSSWAR